MHTYRYISLFTTWLLLLGVLSLTGCNSAGSSGASNTTTASNRLASLQLANGQLDPPFSPAQADYQVTVSSTYLSISLSGESSSASISINGNPASTSQANLVGLQRGENLIEIVVSNADSGNRSYHIIANRLSNNADLTELRLLGAEFSPAFNKDQLSYTANVAYGTDSIVVNARLSDVNAQLSIMQQAVASSVDTLINLSVGANSVPFVVTAEDNSIKTYQLVINRSAPTQSSSLSGITLSAGSLSPVFSPDSFSYSVSLPYGNNSIDINATLNTALASMSVNGVATLSAETRSLALNIGNNPVQIIVNEPDGSSKTYQINISRASASGNTQLSSISLNHGTLTPAFDSGVYSYETHVPYSISSVTVSATKSEPLSTLQINTLTLDSNIFILNVGSNIIDFKVTAEDGSNASYRLNMIREIAASDARLASLSLSYGSLSPAFNSDVYNYSASAPYPLTSLTTTAVVSDSNYTGMRVNGAITASGSSSAAVSLTQGDNTLVVAVTAEDGSTQKSYTVTVTREAPFTRGVNLSNNANVILSESNVAEWASWGVNTVRIHFNKDDNSDPYTNPPTAGNIWVPYTAAKARTEQWITWLANNNIKVIVVLDYLWGDDHNSTAMWSNGGNNVYLQHRIDLAVAAAQWLAAYANVSGIELWNEPHPYDNLYRDYYLPTVIPAIRAVNADIQLIAMSPYDWGLPQGLYNWNGLGIADANLAYSTHIYNPWTYTHQSILGNPADSQGWPGNHKEYANSPLVYYDSAWVQDQVAQLRNFEQRSGAKVIITEIGVLRWATDNDKYLKDWIDAFEAAKIQWILHGIGGWNGWNPTFAFNRGESFQPDGNDVTPALTLMQGYWQRNITPP